jgi:predicted branched-subunit amino acid permease
MTDTATPSPAVAPLPRRDLSPARRGALAMLPMLTGFVPFALVIGATAAEHGDPVAGWAGSWLIFGGSAQLAAIRTLEQAGPAAAILTGLLIHARLVVYSASLALRWADQPRWFKVTGAALIIDPTWAFAEQHADRGPDDAEQRGYFLGAALTLGAGWSAAMAAGVVLGARLERLDLDIVVPLCLLGLVGATIRSSRTRIVMVVAGAVAFVTAGWPNGTGLLAAIGAGALAGLVVERGAPS